MQQKNPNSKPHQQYIYIYIAKSGNGGNSYPKSSAIPQFSSYQTYSKGSDHLFPPQCIHPHACRSRHPVLGVRANDIHGVNFGILMGRTSPLTPEKQTHLKMHLVLNMVIFSNVMLVFKGVAPPKTNECRP